MLKATRNLRGHVVEQLVRASESVVLNVAEAHPTMGADSARRFRTAANEASECGAALDLLEEGVATKVDEGGDFLAEGLGGGLWSAEIARSNGERIGITGSFQGTVAK